MRDLSDRDRSFNRDPLGIIGTIHKHENGHSYRITGYIRQTEKRVLITMRRFTADGALDAQQVLLKHE